MSPAPKSRPRMAQPWPYKANAQRLEIRDAANAGREITNLALAAVADNNPQLARTYLAMIATLFADIQRLTVEARVGVEAPTPPEE